MICNIQKTKSNSEGMLEIQEWYRTDQECKFLQTFFQTIVVETNTITSLNSTTHYCCVLWHPVITFTNYVYFLVRRKIFGNTL